MLVNTFFYSSFLRSRAAATEAISSYCFAVCEALLGNNVNVDMHQLSAGAEMNQISKIGILRACKMAMSVDKEEIERKAENILTNMYGAYDAALLSPLTFSALVKDLADQASKEIRVHNLSLNPAQRGNPINIFTW